MDPSDCPLPSDAPLPPGQTRTEKFPVTGEKRASRPLSPESWKLHLTGAVAVNVTLSLDDLLAFPQEELMADIHCVTSWSQLGMRFGGVRLSRLVEASVELLPAARFVSFAAYSERQHDTSLPLELALADSWLIHRYDDKPLPPEHGYPVRVVTPSRYFYKSVKWLREIEFLEEDRLGFWERTSGYHNQGDPWREQRLDGMRFVSQAETRAFRVLENYDAYRIEAASDAQSGNGRVIVKANLRDWCPRTRDLRGLQLKACDFRGADLRGADLREANLTLGRFEGARLEGADLAGADLEGAHLAGAGLAGARLVGNALSATVFCNEGGRGLTSHQGLRVAEYKGLLEGQEAYLRELGVLR